jgi:alkylated DNA repair dioxygenase AlkB
VELTRHRLDDGHALLSGRLPDDLMPDERAFAGLWDLHPPGYHRIKMRGRDVDTPRWQQAYGEDYDYTGRVNHALDVPASLAPLLAWCQDRIDTRLNGLLLNWYDASQCHYLGRHRDSRKNLCVGAPIVTLSFGEARVFRLRPWRAAGKRDFQANHGTIFVMPFRTNLAWTHEVPHFKRYTGRRISVTARAFEHG